MNWYQGELNHPLWIKKRDEILQRDHWTCTSCGSKDNLHVHHTYYLQRKSHPWDYPNKSLLTLCDTCHHDYHCTHEIVVLIKHKFGYRPKYKKPISLAQKVIEKNKIARDKKKYLIHEGRKYKI